MYPPTKRIVGRFVCAIFAVTLVQPAFSHPTGGLSTKSPPEDTNRLTSFVRPSRYDLTFAPNLKEGTFQGREHISISLSRPASEIVLNAVDLTITAAILKLPGKAAQPLKISFDAENERVHFKSSTLIPAGNCLVDLRFAAPLNRKLRGFYAARAQGPNGKEIPLAVTQLEPSDARRMFPCFDEPDFKAVFKITCKTAADITAISNAPVSSNIAAAGQRTISFADTPTMSSYLVALFVGPFKPTKSVKSGGVDITVWSVAQDPALGTRAEEYAAKILTFYTQYFGVPYPEKKLDLIAVPDFEAGAMENLGAISFRETALLFNPKKDSLRSEQSVAGIIAHEMAHMWFGDLVTMKWWDDIWLNEAFATWMAHHAIENICPSWRTWDSWAEAKNDSMDTDGLNSSRAIHADVANPTEAFEMFDDISYSKGAAIIRMLEKYVGSDIFRAGVRKYISRFQFKNAATADLWQAIGDSSGKQVNKMMTGWVYQAGFPILSLSGDKKLPDKLRQTRFFNIEPHITAKPSAPIWTVPVGCLSNLSSQGTHDRGIKYLLMQKREVQLKPETLIEPYFCNANASGYYRVAYPASNLAALAQLQQKCLNPLERYTLLTDQSALVFQGKLAPESFLPFLLSYKNETDPFVILAVCNQLEDLYKLVDKSSEVYLSAYVRDILLPVKQRLTWIAAKQESEPTKLARSVVLSCLANQGNHAETISEARQYFAKYMADFNSISPDLVSTVENIVGHNGNAHDYEQMKSIWQDGPTPSAKNRALMALSLFREPTLLDQTLEMTLSHDVKLQDSPNLLSSSLKQKDNNARVWEFMTSHWQEISGRFPPFMIGRLVSGEADLTTEKQAQDFRNFFDAHPVPEAKRDLERTWERIQNNIAFLSGAQESIHNWLKSRYPE